ncbi:MAG: tRNA adenosine(34) deaminase TadA [Pseudomonadota bacterium]
MGVDSPDEAWMRQALQQAQVAADCDEVPVGAVLVDSDGELIAAGHNRPISSHDPTAHAEIVTLREAAKRKSNYRLPGTTLYVTLEPCAMCVGAIVQARVGRVVFGANEPRTGAIESAHQLFARGSFNHQPVVEGGVLAKECSDIMRRFFAGKRKKNSGPRGC